jgi:MFS family permease
VANIGLPSIMTALDVPFSAVQWVVLSYLVTMTALAVTAGALGDRFGKRRLLMGGLALFAVASALCAATPNLPLLIAGRALQGASAALLNALSLALVVDVVGAGRAGSALGALSATSAIGTMIGPTVGAFVIAAAGWRGIFAVNVPLALLVYVVLRVTSPGAPRSVERKAKPAPVPFTRALFASLGINVLVSGVMVSTLILAPFVLSRTFGLALHNVGLVMAAGPLTTTLTAIPAGRFADRLNGRLVSVGGLVVFTLGACGLAVLRTDIGLVGYLIPVIMIGFGYGAFQTSNNTVIMSESPPERRGVLSGWLGLSRNIGLISGASIIGAVFGAVTHGNAQSGAVVAAALRTAFTGASAMAALALVLALFVYYTARNTRQPRAPMSL